MKKTIIKRFGDNNLGANPTWIVKRRLIDKTEEIPTGWELISTSKASNEIKTSVRIHSILIKLSTNKNEATIITSVTNIILKPSL